MDNQTDGETLWRAFAAAGYLNNLYPEGRTAIKPFITAIPRVISDLSGKRFTFKNFSLTTLAIGTYCLENDFYAKMIHAPDSTAEQVKPIVDRSIEQLAAYLDDIVLGNLKLGDTDDAECVAMINDMLNPESLERYRAGTLTIGDALAAQPSLFCAAIWHFLSISRGNETDEEDGEEDEYEVDLEDEEDDGDGDDCDDGDDDEDFDDGGGDDDGGKPPRGN